MDKKSLWFIAIILCASAIAGYFFVYQPYSEKQLLKQNYVVIKELYETAKSDEPIAGGIKITPNYYPLKDEFDKLSKLKTSLNGLTGKINVFCNGKVQQNALQKCNTPRGLLSCRIFHK